MTIYKNGIKVLTTLWCERCRGWTPHALNKSMTAYVCACGEQAFIVRRIDSEAK